MAGAYADAPGRKFAYDVDGSAGFDQSGGILSGAQLIALNDETVSSISVWTGNTTYYTGIIFPELRDLAGFWFCVPDTAFVSSYTCFTSPDTTNGVDGAWTSRSTAAPANGMTFRSGVTALSVAGQKAIRVGLIASSNGNAGRYLAALHLYGSIPAASTPDRLTLWHPTLDQELGAAGLDYGDVQRSTTTDKTFRVKNRSATLTANSVLLSFAAPTDGTPTMVGQLTLGVAASFATTQTVASIAPGAISAVVTARLITTSAAPLSIWRQRLSAVPASWS